MAHTKSALPWGGRRPALFQPKPAPLQNGGFSSFFQRPAHRLRADAVHYLPLHQSVSQHSQSPTDPSLRGLGAGHGHQMRFTLTVQLFPAAVELLLAAQGGCHTLLHAPAPHPFHRGRAHLQGPGYLLVHHWAVSLVLIAKQQDAGVSLLIGCRPPLGHHRLQLFLFLLRQSHTIFLRHHIHLHFLTFFLLAACPLHLTSHHYKDFVLPVVRHL